MTRPVRYIRALARVKAYSSPVMSPSGVYSRTCGTDMNTSISMDATPRLYWYEFKNIRNREEEYHAWVNLEWSEGNGNESPWCSRILSEHEESPWSHSPCAWSYSGCSLDRCGCTECYWDRRSPRSWYIRMKENGTWYISCERLHGMKKSGNSVRAPKSKPNTTSV